MGKQPVHHQMEVRGLIPLSQAPQSLKALQGLEQIRLKRMVVGVGRKVPIQQIMLVYLAVLEAVVAG